MTAQPLEGLKVLDLAWVVAGPLIGRSLADYGATVVRIESSRRVETARLMGPFPKGVFDVQQCTLYENTNAGKLGLALDLRRPEAQAVVRAGRYAPMGARSFGPVVAGMRRANHFEWSTDGIAIIPMIETVEAIANLDGILAVPGIDAIYVGPADLSITLGLKPGNNDGESKFDDALQTIVAACRKAGIVPGIHATAALVERRLEQGFRMITVTSDTLALKGSLTADLAIARGARPADAKSGAMY